VAAETLKIALEAKTGDRQPERENPVEEEGPDSGCGEEVRRVVRHSGRCCERTQDVGGLRADVMNRSLRLIPRADGSLGLQYRLLGLFPLRIEELEVSVSPAWTSRDGRSRCPHARREFRSESVFGRCLFPRSGSDGRGSTRLQIGRGCRPAEKVTLRAAGGFLFVDYSIPVLFPGTASFAIAPDSDTEAVIRGLGRGMGETLRVVTVNGEEMLSYSGYLLRKKRG